MTSVTERSQAGKPVTRYAVYYCPNGAVIYGTAELLVGYGWLFKADDGSWFEVMKPMDVTRGKMDIFGDVSVADAQLREDRLKGGYAAIACTRAQEIA
jgi:hypothetical protein